MSKQEEIKQALAAATPGPWNKEGDEIWRRGSAYGGDEPHVYICDATSENANLIAKAPEYIAYLLEENERLHSALETTLFHLKKEYYMSAEDAIEEALAVGQEGEGNHEPS